MSIFNFIMTCDFDRPELDVICDLIYHTNNYRIPPSQVVFGDPSVVDPRMDIEDDINTFIPATVDRNFDTRLDPNQTGFLYTRIPLGAISIVPNTTINAPAFPFSTWDIIGIINMQLGLRLTHNDVEDIVYTSLDQDFILKAKPQSKIWIGERRLLVNGGGDKTKLFPNDLASSWLTPSEVGIDQKTQLTNTANLDNGQSWQRLVDFTFGDIEGNITNQAGRNTRVYIRSLKEGYEDQWLYYVRVDPKQINQQFINQSIPVIPVPVFPFTAHELIPVMNQLLHLQLTIDDIEDTPFEPGLSQYPIQFKSSFAWIRGVYQLNATQEEWKYPNTRMNDDRTVRLVTTGIYRKTIE